MLKVEHPKDYLKNDPNAGTSQNDQCNTDLHKYALLGKLKDFQDSFQKLEKDNPNNYLEIVSSYNHYRETALSLAIENENFDIAIWLLKQLKPEQIADQFDRLVSVNSEKFDKLFDDARIKDEDKIIKSLSHKASELKYNRHGGDYQSKLLMLFAYESHSSDIQFRLGSEVSSADKFDDLVFRYKDSDGKFKYIYLQAKHEQHLDKNPLKKSQFTQKGHKYELKKYFTTYLVDDPSQVDNLVLCTNNHFGFDPKDFHFQEIDKKTRERENQYKIFSDLGGKLYKFNFKDENDKNNFINELFGDYVPPNDRNRIKIFLSKFVFAVEQPSSILLGKKIREKMGSDTYNFIYFATFKEYIDEWFASRESDNTARFILSSEIRDFFDRLKNKIANIELKGLASLSKREIEKFTQYGLKFNDNSKDISNIKNFLNSNDDRILKLTYKEKDGFLSIAKVYQILKEKYQDTAEYTVSDLYSLSSLNFDIPNQERVVNALKSENKRLLVIECNFIDENGKKLISKLYTEVLAKSVSIKKVILVLNEKLNDQLPDLSSTTVVMENSLNSFTSESKDTILEIKIMLFGEQRELISLTTDASKDSLYLDGDSLTTLINGGSNIIGSKHGYDFDIYIDIPRTLTYQTKIDKECLKENKNDLFAIGGIEKGDFSQLVPREEERREFVEKAPEGKGPIRFIRLDNNHDIKKDFDQLCSDHAKHNIHLLENKDSVLEWKQSHGSLFNLRRFILDTGSQTKKIKDLTDSAIIAGEAGMGKSTILTTYSMSKDFLWPIRINLKDYQTDINNANFDDLSGIVEFLSNIIDPASSKTSLIKNLLQYCLTQQGQVTLLLDGYDEIKDRSQEKVVQLLRTLRTTQGKVLITTRLYARSELEDALGIFAYSLNPFSEEEQKEFLKNFWIEKLNVREATQKNKIDAFTKQLLNYFHELNLMKKEGLVGIVLQARMVAEIFQNECKGYLEREKFNFSNFRITNISDLYERFIEYQYERYLKERIEISAKLSEGSRTSLTRSYTKAYGNLALKSLFSEDQIQELLRKERFSGEELQDIGLIKILKNDGTADFLHPTYAEYFVADFLVNALRKEKDHPKYRAVDNFLRMQIFRDHNKVIRSFVRNKIENDSDLSSKWKAIEDCDLLKEVENIVKLQPTKSISVPDHLNPTDDALSEKSLSDLQQDVEECMNWQDDRYYYNGGTKLINKLFQKFLRETDIKALETTLEFLLKANGKSYYGLANQEFSRENNIARAIEHYFSEVKKKGTISSLPNNLRNDYIKVKINNEEVFTKLEEILKNLTNTNNKEKYLKKLIHLLIPKSITSIEILKELNNLCYSLDIVYPNIIDDVKSYIKSTEDTKKKYAERIINSLKDINCGNCGYINHDLENSSNLKSLQSFFIDILYHPSVIAYTKSSINEIYKDKKLWWLERQGVLISRVLEIITPEMSERFNSALDGKIDGGTRIYSDGIFVDLINYVVNRVGEEELPQVNKLPFLKMLVRFVGFSVEANKELPFTSEQLKTTLKLTTQILNEQLQLRLLVSESIEYLHILGKAGLKLIDAKKELLVIDPAGKFQYKLLSGYVNQIIELIKWKSENPANDPKNFLKKYYETIELKKGNLNRKGSESDLQELRRMRVVDPGTVLDDVNVSQDTSAEIGTG